MNIVITLEQYQKLKRLSDFADWYIDDMEPSNPCYEDDKEDITQAQEVLERIDASLLNQHFTFEPAIEE
jgi:hypothetical protein